MIEVKGITGQLAKMYFLHSPDLRCEFDKKAKTIMNFNSNQIRRSMRGRSRRRTEGFLVSDEGLGGVGVLLYGFGKREGPKAGEDSR